MKAFEWVPFHPVYKYRIRDMSINQPCDKVSVNMTFKHIYTIVLALLNPSYSLQNLWSVHFCLPCASPATWESLLHRDWPMRKRQHFQPHNEEIQCDCSVLRISLVPRWRFLAGAPSCNSRTSTRQIHQDTSHWVEWAQCCLHLNCMSYRTHIRRGNLMFRSVKY